jgi:hypothetical protein
MGKVYKAPPRVKKSRITSTARGYFHDLDPYKFHATKQDATKDRSSMLQMQDVKSRAPRVSTFYTILQDKRKNNPQKFGNVPQGPHTFPHHGIHTGIVEAYSQDKLSLFSSVIPSPSQYNARVDAEIPVGHLKRPRAELTKVIFKKRHARFERLAKLMTPNRIRKIEWAHVTNKLLQMDPYGSYSYKGKGAGKKALSGKGESSLLPLAQQVDLPSNSGFNHISGVTTRSQSLLKILGKVGVQ